MAMTLNGSDVSCQARFLKNGHRKVMKSNFNFNFRWNFSANNGRNFSFWCVLLMKATNHRHHQPLKFK
jgi:hypothetical protein